MECEEAEYFFAIFVAYFVFDLIPTIYYKMDMYKVFVVHHIFGATPYTICCFVPGGQNLPFLLGAGSFVELTNPCHNTEYILELLDMQGHWSYPVVVVVTFVAWSIFRFIMPFYLVAILFAESIPVYKGQANCIASYCTGIFVCIFCTIGYLTDRLPRTYRLCYPHEAPLDVLQPLENAMEPEDLRDFRSNLEAATAIVCHLPSPRIRAASVTGGMHHAERLSGTTPPIDKMEQASSAASREGIELTEASKRTGQEFSNNMI